MGDEIVTVLLSYHQNHWGKVAVLSNTRLRTKLTLGSLMSQTVTVPPLDGRHRFNLVVCDGGVLSEEFLKIELPTRIWVVETVKAQSISAGRQLKIPTHFSDREIR